MKKLERQRNAWLFASLCFLLSIILFLSDDKAVEGRTVFMVVAFMASFINAYNAHRKLQK